MILKENLEEDAAEYRKEIKKLVQQQNEEEIFLRGCLFKREIPKFITTHVAFRE